VAAVIGVFPAAQTYGEKKAWMIFGVCLKQGVSMRENHANARKMFCQPFASGQNWDGFRQFPIKMEKFY
jgi:hypothetical protein